MAIPFIVVRLFINVSRCQAYQLFPPQAHVATAPLSSTSPSWLLDLCSFHHVTNDIHNISLHHPYDGAEEIIVGNCMGVPLDQMGLVSPPTFCNYLNLANVLCA